MIVEDFNNDDKKFDKSEKVNEEITNKSEPKKLNEGFVLFVTAFFALLLLFLGIVKQLSPDVDVTISDNSDSQENIDESEIGIIDSRLKDIQNEDDYNEVSNNETFSPELDEKVVLPKPKPKLVGENSALDDVVDKKFEVKKQNEENSPKENQKVEQPKAEQPTQPQQAQTTVNTKVIIGYYTTKAQAEVAKDILLETGVNAQPFVRTLGNAYTIQIGSYTSREKAQSVANELLKKNLPAKILVE